MSEEFVKRGSSHYLFDELPGEVDFEQYKIEGNEEEIEVIFDKVSFSFTKISIMADHTISLQNNENITFFNVGLNKSFGKELLDTAKSYEFEVEDCRVSEPGDV